MNGDELRELAKNYYKDLYAAEICSSTDELDINSLLPLTHNDEEC